jgi:NAD(P)-dependent dehydrogenase (short-subunit alcohol dehydrogenase family)
MQNYFITGANSTSAKSLIAMLSQIKTSSLGLFCKNSEELKAELEQKDIDISRFFFYSGDAKNFEGLQASISDFKTQVNFVNGLAHFPGSILLKPVTSTKIEEFEDVLSTNLTTAFLALKAILPVFKEQGSEVPASIVFLSSVAAQKGLPNHEAISAAKAGLEGMARSVAATYPKVRCNCVAPGLTNAKMTSKLIQNEKALAASLSLNAIQRAGEAQDIANAVKFLLGTESSFVTGQVLGVDGGMSTLGFPRS